MSRLLGPCRQNGYVVPDIEAAIAGWVGVGVGPWIVHPHVPVAAFAYRGEPGEVDVTIALANSGPLQIELIQPHDESPSLYSDFLRQHPGGGLQHLGYWVDDFDTVRQACLDAGWAVGHEGSILGGRFTYFDTEFHGGSVMEIAEMDETRRAGFARIEARCEQWDGSEPSTRVVDLRNR
jgi:hypothetical protein